MRGREPKRASERLRKLRDEDEIPRFGTRSGDTMRALYTSATGMMAQQFNLDVIANNLSNVNTTGFKKSSAHFQDLLYQSVQTPGLNKGNGGQVGLGVTGGTTNHVFSQGTLQPSGNDLDLAVKG